MNNDPIRDAEAALQTAVGTQETELRVKLGNAGYERWARLSDAIDDAKALDSMRHADQTKAQNGYIEAKAMWWRSLARLAWVAGACGFAWSVFEMVGH